MTGERAKRFPLGLEDLVREPRRADARGAKAGAAKPAASKPAATKTAVPNLNAQAAGRARSGVSGTVAAKTPAGAKGATGILNSNAKAASSSARTPAITKSPSGIVNTKGATTIRNDGARNQLPRPVTTSFERTGAPNVALTSAVTLTSERVRERMVERLRANGITDPRVLDAMAMVPRHMFVDPGLATQAYEDAALPIGHHQTISKPSVVARMIELAAQGRTLANVLEIGTGCGYQAAVLSHVARDVYSIERIKPLYERAKTNLRPLRIPNIRLHYGDGRIGLPAAAPFDAIVIAAAGLDVPQALLEQLAIGARLVAPVGSQDGQSQVLTLVERTGPAQWRESRLDRVFFVPLKSGVI
ncbi:protein-L-isoaspartate(D-aspartate) O-methyltransferase [Paraburkholderia hospita]|jgi:protein-L-isoaspartate(D-aspartate) O-methyltransferase|uniref:Protein-L-isoaspartate O-methyltransferase n=1 Tax=Paraburkholderia hospita TaxID=169430 RepID=A0ABP2PNK3_9BURK|nr:protein-L-isoaspartate(D-aspartate) O-methyltransferase [Paraburkholderia hospita]AXE98600.1 protein-L-isoaspartate(D-aspartate) O-methyltransferase [Paraburkholderia hospita]EIM97893.1 protein-L-isoaspartate O-methyltransferase [Paraburkholderia hospita]OUL90441.1 protein-L-isoaspartate O-methyltransferase [Paraburkholderia hospita]OUL96898.1 protein-L-isoaspartate O-methyltransferase [Paraburkholderia hospita]